MDSRISEIFDGSLSIGDSISDLFLSLLPTKKGQKMGKHWSLSSFSQNGAICITLLREGQGLLLSSTYLNLNPSI